MKHIALPEPSLHRHAPFSLSIDEMAELSAMNEFCRDHQLGILAQSHHYRSFPILGVFDSLSGRPQMADWAKHRALYEAEARATYRAHAAAGTPDMKKEAA